MILDTDFLIDLMEGKSNALKRKDKLNEDRENYRTTALTIFELWFGLAMSKKPESEKEKILSALSGIDTLKLSRESAEKAGEIHGSLTKKGETIGATDSMIAAIALLENEAILTGNSRHFSRVPGLRIESY
jgi:tRNA(fMet)-specific endonuclease VapC